MQLLIIFSCCFPLAYFLFFFNATATTEIYTLSLHDALPIFSGPEPLPSVGYDVPSCFQKLVGLRLVVQRLIRRSEEHTSELQSPDHLVCRLLLEKKKKQNRNI